MEEIQKRIEAEESSIKKNARMLSQKNRIMAEDASYSEYSTQAFSDEEETNALVKVIDEFISQTAVALVDIKSSGVRKSSFTKKFMVDLTCESTIAELFRFIHQVENSNLLLAIEEFDIIPKSKDADILIIKLSISKTVMLDSP